MNALYYTQFCEEARLYYYDLLCEETMQSVPKKVVNHIIGCSRCREQMNQLETMLYDYKEKPATDLSHQQTAAAAMLKLHFAYVGKHVTCSVVRSFLPALLVPELQIRIPTPITVHLDNCEQCREDLKTLQDLNLSPKQLRTLSQLFADDTVADEVECESGRSAAPIIVAMAFDRMDSRTLRHLSLCPRCREEVYKLREAILQQRKSGQNTSSGENIRFPCPSVTSSDFFDYCITYNIDPASDEYAKFRKSLTLHINCCADCLGKIQQLHRAIYGIVDKPESGITTVFHVDVSAKAEPEAMSNNPYAGFPVRVEVADLEDVRAGREQFRNEDLTETAKPKTVSNNLRPLLRVALPVAAAIVIAVGLLFYVPSAKAFTIGQIYKAVDTVRNIYISSFVPDRQGPVQQVWISRSSELYVTRTGNELTLWSIAESMQKTKDLGTGAIRQVSLDIDGLAAVRAKIYGSLGIMPFGMSSDVPQDAVWTEITDSDLLAKAENTKVYELSWIELAYDGSTVQRKWRVFTDASTKLPRKVQWFIQSASDAQPVLELTMLIEYPSNKEVLTKVQSMSF